MYCVYDFIIIATMIRIAYYFGETRLISHPETADPVRRTIHTTAMHLQQPHEHKRLAVVAVAVVVVVVVVVVRARFKPD